MTNYIVILICPDEEITITLKAKKRKQAVNRALDMLQGKIPQIVICKKVEL